MQANEGPSVTAYCNSIVKSLEQVIQACQKVAGTLRKVRQSKLDPYLLTAERQLRLSCETDEGRWRQLCEYARAENKAETRFLTSNSHQEKARVRIASLDSSGVNRERTNSLTPKMPAGVGKALGNVMSILPNRGEHAMKIMSPDAQRIVAQNNLNEADQRSSKDKEAWEQAKRLKDNALENYQIHAKKFVESLQLQHDNGQQDVESAVEALVAAMREYRHDHLDAIAVGRGPTQQDRARDTAAWTNATAAKLGAGPDGYYAPGLSVLLMQNQVTAWINNESHSSVDGHGNVEAKNEEVDGKEHGDTKSTGVGDNDDSQNLNSSNSHGDDDNSKSRAQGGGTTNSAGDNENNATVSETATTTTSTADPPADSMPTANGSMQTPRKRFGTDGSGNEMQSLSDFKTPKREDILLASPDPISRRTISGSPVSHDSDDVVTTTTTKMTSNGSTDTNDLRVILAYFLSEPLDDKMPTVSTSFSCAYWPKESEGFVSRIIYGRIFVTPQTFCFVEWGGKKLILDWSSFTSIDETVCLSTKLPNGSNGTEHDDDDDVDNAMRITCAREGKDKTYFLGSFRHRDESLRVLNRATAVAKEEAKVAAEKAAAAKEKEEKEKEAMRKKEEQAAAAAATTTTSKATEKSVPSKPVPPDPVMSKMETLLTKRIPGISIQQYYDSVWSEGEGTNCPPFYGPTLEEMGSLKVLVTPWEVASSDGPLFQNVWCGDDYERRRSVTFEFKRTTHLYVGPPIAKVRQTQFCRVEGNDRCVLHTLGEFDGIPYADCFAVEVRWTATRDGDGVKVEVGVFVNFKKSTMFAKQIRSGTVVETKPIHEKIFAKAAKACLGARGDTLANGTDGAVVDADVANDTGVASNHVTADTKSQNDGDIIGRLSTWVQEVAIPSLVSGDPVAVGIALLVAYLFLRWLFVPSAPPQALLSEVMEQRMVEEMAGLRQKVESLETELKAVHVTLKETLTELVRQKGAE